MNKKGIIIVAGGIFITEVAWYFYKKYKSRIFQRPRNIKTKVFFSSEDSVLCITHFKSGQMCERMNCPVRTIK